MLPIDVSAIRHGFDANFAFRGELGASVSVWQDGREILSLAGGWRDRQQSTPWRADTLVLMWSITKGLAASCLLHALALDGIGLETPVAALWPEFAQNGKEGVTLAQLLSHQAGLAAMASPEVSLFDHDAVAAALAAQAPVWPPGRAHGYGPRTFGFLMDECLRRLRPGQTLGQYWRAQFGDPLGLDIWIGLPDELAVRVASVYPAKSGPGQHGTLDPFYEALAVEDSLTRRAFAGPRGLHSVASMNTPDARRASLPSLGGIGTASSLAKCYALRANGGSLEGHAYSPPQAVAWMSTPLANGHDETLCRDTAFSAGFMQDPLGPDGRKLRQLFGPSTRAFGQPGAGGGHAFADPEHNVAFAYLMNQMELGVLPNEKSLSLVAAIYGATPEPLPTASAVC